MLARTVSLVVQKIDASTNSTGGAINYPSISAAQESLGTKKVGLKE
jgi:hypothetical protein